MNIENFFFFKVKPLPLEKQSQSAFWFYTINLLLALCAEISWGFIMPSPTDAVFGIYSTIGFLTLSLAEIVFATLAIRHIDSVEQNSQEAS